MKKYPPQKITKLYWIIIILEIYHYFVRKAETYLIKVLVTDRKRESESQRKFLMFDVLLIQEVRYTL